MISLPTFCKAHAFLHHRSSRSFAKRASMRLVARGAREESSYTVARAQDKHWQLSDGKAKEAKYLGTPGYRVERL
jgi:hypothetical protein